MPWFPFKLKKLKRSPKSFLGIDIGTSSIRVVELGRAGQAMQLVNYGEIKVPLSQKEPFKIVEDGITIFSNQQTAKAIEAIVKEAGIDTRASNFSIPDFFSFFTSFEMPPMNQKELENAVKYEARRYIPLPLSEITLDWSVVEGEVGGNNPLKILVVAVPNEIIRQYQEISSLSGVQIKSLEAEVFALSRSLARKEDGIIAIIDIGARSTTCNVLEKGVLKVSHSFNIAGNGLTEILVRSLKINYQEAEDLKKEIGLKKTGESSGEPGFQAWSPFAASASLGRNIREILLPLVDSILTEAKRTIQNFSQQENKEVEKIILTGGSALLPGLKEYFSEATQKEAQIANPFSSLSSPSVLSEMLAEMGPSYSVAVGSAIKGLE